VAPARPGLLARQLHAVQLLAPLASLPRWQQPPSVLAELRYRGLRVRPALANLHVALELAFDRDGTAAASVPAGALRFTGRWRAARPPPVLARPRRVGGTEYCANQPLGNAEFRAARDLTAIPEALAAGSG